ncbi:MAG: hypothetical protein Q9N68_08900, partial [Gammaproteobacteria bacterium]|nr:hypothetical protein [Gammaproteobacteria bacterium]
MKKQTEHSVISLLKQNLSREKNPTSNTHSIQKYTPLKTDEVIFIHIEELTFEQESPRREALENILSTLTIDGIQLVYLLIGDENGVSFYFAIAKDKNHTTALELDVDDIGRYILKPSIEGNFRGSKITEQSKNKAQILATINGMKRIQRLDGVPTVNTEDGSFQGVDRLVDVMMGDQFVLMVLASPLNEASIEQIETDLYNIHNTLSPKAKESIQDSEGSSLTSGTSKTWGTSDTSGSNKGSSTSKSTSSSKGQTTGSSSGETIGRSDGETEGETTGDSTGVSNTKTTGTSKDGSSSSSTNSVAKGTSHTKNTGTSTTKNTGSSVSKNTGQSKSSNTGSSDSSSTSSNSGTSNSKTTNSSDSTNSSNTTNQGSNKSREFTDKLINEWLQYIDEVLLKRLHHGQKRGLFNACAYLLANEKGTLIKLGNTMKALFSGDENNRTPLRLSPIHAANEIANIKNLQLSTANSTLTQAQQQNQLLHSKNSPQYAHWMSSSELSVIMGLPQKEVVGLALKEEVEFGLNIKKQNLKQENKLLLGHLVHSGGALNIKVHIDKAHLNKHTFVTGVTGSGKTSTCLRLLDSAQMPFLVIEPAKTEYRILTQKHDDILIFTLGDDRVAPFRLNPFEFFPGENITARVDMIKATIEAAFDMEAAIPQLIEAALYQCYEDYG